MIVIATQLAGSENALTNVSMVELRFDVTPEMDLKFKRTTDATTTVIANPVQAETCLFNAPTFILPILLPPLYYKHYIINANILFSLCIFKYE
jgi:hypothetical protein